MSIKGKDRYFDCLSNQVCNIYITMDRWPNVRMLYIYILSITLSPALAVSAEGVWNSKPSLSSPVLFRREPCYFGLVSFSMCTCVCTSCVIFIQDTFFLD